MILKWECIGTNSISYVMKVLKVLVIMIFLYYAFLMVLITLQYIPIDLTIAFLATKQYIIYQTHYQIAFFAHVFCSIFMLLIGALQFSQKLRLQVPRLHKRIGYFYVFGILCISAPSGFIMGIYGNGGIITSISFCLLSILWFYYTLKSFLAVRRKKVMLHKEYMILSYALTLSALTLRLHKQILANTTDLHRMDIYRIVSWSGWIINLLIAFWIIRRANNKAVTTPMAQ
ncbi:MAG: DUF2306 domain-containing protein [Bacteroidetes bacterium]|nr:DUF2306 domain-containing protein [bacterium]NBP63215.1 DUF2306 domain-containing protein [Bacteroidota bacterium]